MVIDSHNFRLIVKRAKGVSKPRRPVRQHWFPDSSAFSNTHSSKHHHSLFCGLKAQQ